MKNNLLILILAITVMACKKNEPKQDSAVKLLGVSLEYKNNNNQNLLDPTVPNAINTDAIRVFVLKNGVKEEINKPMMDMPRNFKISTSSRGNLLHIYFEEYAPSYPDNKITMFIKYENGSEDKLTGQFHIVGETHISLRTLWVNDQKQWEWDDHTPAHAVIIK